MVSPVQYWPLFREILNREENINWKTGNLGNRVVESGLREATFFKPKLWIPIFSLYLTDPFVANIAEISIPVNQSYKIAIIHSRKWYSGFAMQSSQGLKPRIKYNLIGINSLIQELFNLERIFFSWLPPLILITWNLELSNLIYRKLSHWHLEGAANSLANSFLAVGSLTEHFFKKICLVEYSKGHLRYCRRGFGHSTIETMSCSLLIGIFG